MPDQEQVPGLRKIKKILEEIEVKGFEGTVENLKTKFDKKFKEVLN